ncbi:MAG: hypothetical protein EA417_18350 [Gammaproteobacteria bacterium]|nr:MAG: hypothetical protein EA417_18350 [Gammaproteobacteria bacterium]
MRTLSLEETAQVSGGLVQTNDDLGDGFGMPGAPSIMDLVIQLERDESGNFTATGLSGEMVVTAPSSGTKRVFRMLDGSYTCCAGFNFFNVSLDALVERLAEGPIEDLPPGHPGLTGWWR